MSEPLTAREFLSLVDPSRPFIPELHEDDCDDVSCARCVKPASSTSAMDVPAAQLAAEARALADKQRAERTAALEQQIAELREHAVQHLAERGTEPSPEHWAQWHEFLDIDPDLRGRDYTTGGTA